MEPVQSIKGETETKDPINVHQLMKGMQRQSKIRKVINYLFNINTTIKFIILWLIMAVALPLNGFSTYFLLLLAAIITIFTCCKWGNTLDSNNFLKEFCCIIGVVISSLFILIVLIALPLSNLNPKTSYRYHACPNCYETKSIEFKNSVGKFTCTNCGQRNTWRFYAFWHSYSSAPIFMTNWTKTTKIYDEESGQLMSEYISEINHDPRTHIYNFLKEKATQ